MDKSFINDIDTLVIVMSFDGSFSISVGYEDDILPPDECTKYVGALLESRALNFLRDVSEIITAGSVNEVDIDSITWVLKYNTMKITCEYWGTNESQPSQALKNVSQEISEVAKTAFLDMLDELDAVMKKSHQRLSPTVEFTVKKEVEVA